MNTVIDFITNPQVLRTLVSTMAVTAFLAALPPPGTPFTWGLIYKFFYDWLIGFWSLKTGHPVQPIVLKSEVNSKAGNEPQ